MGLLDIPAPLFSWVDTVLMGVLPALVRLCLWGLLGGGLSMLIYHLLSPQDRLAQVKGDAAQALKALAGYDGPFEGLWPLLKNSIGLSLKQIGLALGPTLVASLPVLFVLVWVSNTYDGAEPQPGAQIQFSVLPNEQTISITPAPNPGGLAVQNQIIWPASGEMAHLYDGQGMIVATLPLPGTVPVLHKRLWWNAIIGNPSGYLPVQSDVDQIEFKVPARTYLEFGPNWIRTWEALFFTVLILSSLMIKFIFRIH